MAQTYLFSERSRDEVYEHETSYCFKLRRGKGWLHLNRKATELLEHDDHYEVRLADWYINIGDKFISQTIIRQEQCQELQEWYYKTKVNE
jgi:hypothetical protein